MIQYSLLDEPVLSVVERSTQTRCRLTLPGVLAALAADNIEDFPALRPHQRHVWHAFLVQAAALYLHRNGQSELPRDEGSWRSALLSLTPNDPDGAAWALVTPSERPAFLQPPVPGGSLAGFKTIVTPDDLDMLVTAKNHDVKRQSIRNARAEHWMFALLSLQTQEGFLGAGNYGISRMNGGFASRPSIGIEPSGAMGRRFSRDASRLVALRDRLLEEYDFYPTTDGHALLWLLAWDGVRSISPKELDVFYIEICRRVRIVLTTDGRMRAVATGTKAPRIDAKPLRGRTGDAWTPLIADAEGRKALTIDAGSMGYKKLVPILFPRSSDTSAAIRAPLQEISTSDDSNGLSVLVRGIVRGQGKTPHPRGDGPRARSRFTAGALSPPPAWGWTRPRDRRHDELVVSPTRVGMDPSMSATRCTPPRLPHPRGDGPGCTHANGAAPPSPPPAWGWTRENGRVRRAALVSPTRVGMDPQSATAGVRS